MPLTITAQGLGRVFSRRTIFSEVSFLLEEKQVLLITGRNGSGKSTIVKIVTSVLSPSSGSVEFRREDVVLRERERMDAVGLVSPYLQLYDEFSARENLQYAEAMRGRRPDNTRISQLLVRVALRERGDDPVGTYSSGMKQRAKYSMALVHNPPVLVLDEPMANLDAEGIGIVREIMEEHRTLGLLIVATNDLTDLSHFDSRIDLDVKR